MVQVVAQEGRAPLPVNDSAAWLSAEVQVAGVVA